MTDDTAEQRNSCAVCDSLTAESRDNTGSCQPHKGNSSFSGRVERIREENMPNRRDFIKGVAGATAGLWAANGVFTGDALAQNQEQGQGRGGRGGARQEDAPSGPVVRREVRVGNKRVKVIDVHSHASIPEVADVVKGTPAERFARGGGGRPLGDDRIRELDK